MRSIKIIVLCIVFSMPFISRTQTLQQVTNNGASTTSDITAHSFIGNSSSFSGVALPTNISALNGLRINGTIADVSRNGITYQSGGGGGTAISFYRGGSYDTGLDFYTNASNIAGNIQHRMRIASNGFVGIGTTDPVSKLDVLGVIRYGNNTNSVGALSYGNGLITLEAISTNTSISLLPSGNGNVGVGTTDTKGYKLAVAGGMIAESVKVKLQTAWPDFVFTKSYQLPTLKETEEEIRKSGHLPGIPTAAEVKVNGVDLGEMNAKLLQKIEELTLHLIEQDKRLKKLEFNQKSNRNE